ncbi:hypothetical protein [Antarctobacter jejuensis]|uniref:hypothetical protein n=1 Tax=Antarctobacter jejuensis TaxID=1439938 RepID=UPI003FD17405
MKPIVVDYGKYTLKAGIVEGKAVARAFLRDARRPGVIVEVDGSDPEAALKRLKVTVDDLTANRRAKRRESLDADFLVPTVEEFQEALVVAKLSSVQEAMLVAHAKAGERGLTAGEIADIGGYANFETANAIYGKAGRIIAEAIGVTPPPRRSGDKDAPTAVLAEGGEPRPDTGFFVWVMYPELREALLGPEGANFHG